MTVIFSDDTLRRAAEEPAFYPDGWSSQTLAEFRRRVHRLDAVHSEVDLRNVRSIGARPRSDGEGYAIDLGEGVVLHLGVEAGRRGWPVQIDLKECVVRRKEKSL